MTDETIDIPALMREIGAAAKDAAGTLAGATTEAKNRALTEAANCLRANTAGLLEANAEDMQAAGEKGLTASLLDRLALDEARIGGMAAGLDQIAALDDPVGFVMDRWQRPNGLDISRVRVPLGVVGIIYESRPNVTADAGSLCLKSGNASILRGGSESFHSSTAILECMRQGLKLANLPAAAIQMVPTTDRAAVGEMLTMTDYIDVIVPRGGRSLVERVQTEAKVPVFAHLEGICHTYIDAGSDPDMARDIVVNAKMRRTSICGATETLLIDRRAAATHLPMILDALTEAGCEIRGDADTQALDDRIGAATDDDWEAEYLDAVIAVKQVDGVGEAVRHINTHGSEHTDAIVTDDAMAAETFLNGVNSAIAMHNTSTQFADGGEFGMGAEIGISTGKMHARGPVGVDQLTTFKYVVRGTGQIRP
jgi:glutamate-5-semialdehyde dehydrogenase